MRRLAPVLLVVLSACLAPGEIESADGDLPPTGDDTAPPATETPTPATETPTPATEPPPPATEPPPPATEPPPPATETPPPATETPPAATFSYTRLSGPTRTAVSDADGAWVATFTLDARTVRLRGPSRTFRDPDAAATVTTRNWVRLLDAPWGGTVDEDWLRAALADTSPDILAIATEYVTGAPRDASYGPLVDGVREEGSDFHDYLGMSWRFPTGTVVDADPAQLGSLDCSGFQRMVWGYRGGIELGLSVAADHRSLPRRSADLWSGGPGVVTIPNGGAQVTNFDALASGDLVFFDAQTDDGTAIDHVGLYLGVDADGHHRFVSSRKIANGPTFGDVGGPSTLDGTALYARSFRAARRL